MGMNCSNRDLEVKEWHEMMTLHEPQRKGSLRNGPNGYSPCSCGLAA